MERIGFIGLGLMGSPMARRLIASGYALTVWNRTPEKAEPVLAAGATWAESARAVAAGADVVITMVTDSRASEAVVLGPGGVLEGAHSGLILMDMSSITPESSREIARAAAEKGVPMLDAPVTGSTLAAAEGQLGIMAGGKRETFDLCLPLLNSLGAKVLYCGPNGSGCTLKLINNLILGVAVEACCEAMVLAAKAGLDPRLVMDITSVGGARTGAMESRGPRILSRDFAPRFSIDNQHKDLTNAVALAQEHKVPLPVTTATREVYQAARAAGDGALDSAALIKVLEMLASVTVP